MRKSVLAIPLLSLWAVIAMADPQPKPDPAAEYFAQESKLASQGDVAAEDCLSWLYGQGFGTARDPDKMIHWADVAAKAGSDAGKLDLAKSYAWGVGVKADPKKAFAMTQELAAKGYAPAESALGVLYITGTGVATDPAKSVEWLTKAAEAGDFEGQIRLGSFYNWGKYVKANPAEAQKWLDKAAQHKSDCAAEYFFQMPFLINAYLNPKAISAKDARGTMGISFTNNHGKADNVRVFQPSGSHAADDAWAEAARKAKLPPWPESYHSDDKTSGFWIPGTYEGYDPAFVAAVKAAIHNAKVLPKDVLLHGSKGTGKVTVSFDYLDGVARNEKVVQSSGDPSEDAAALAAVANAKYPPTPYQYVHRTLPSSIIIDFGTYAPDGSTAVPVPAATTTVPAPAPATH